MTTESNESKKIFGMNAWYHGDPDPALDAKIKDAAMPGVWWAQGYDMVRSERDISFDYKSESERQSAIKRVMAVIDDNTVVMAKVKKG